MSRRRTYYLGRVHLINLDQEHFIQALCKPLVVEERSYSWTIISPTRKPDTGSPEYVYGKLAKYQPEGRVVSVDETKHVERDVQIEDLLTAASPFVYLPT